MGLLRSPGTVLVLGLATAVVAGMACDPCQRQEALLRADGGAYACVVDTDCPRPGTALVCTTDVVDVECVQCTGSRCLRIVPEPCR